MCDISGLKSEREALHGSGGTHQTSPKHKSCWRSNLRLEPLCHVHELLYAADISGAPIEQQKPERYMLDALF